MALPLIPLAIAGQAAYGLFQKAKGNKLARNLVRPIQTVQNEFIENAANAENMSRVGMPTQQYNNSLNNIQRNTNAGLRMSSRLGGGNIASIVRAQNDATMGVDAQDANTRIANQRFAINQKGILGAQKQAAFDWNQKGSYLEKLAEAQSLKGAGTQNIGGAMNTAAQMGIMSQMENPDESTGFKLPKLGNLFRRKPTLGSQLGITGYGAYSF